MTKLIGAFCASGFFIALIWLVMFQLNVGDLKDLPYYHLDLYTMLGKFNIATGWVGDTFTSLFRQFIDTMKFINSKGLLAMLLSNNPSFSGAGWQLLLTALESLFNPLVVIGQTAVVGGYLLALVILFLTIVTSVFTSLFDFIFQPVFIYWKP